MCTWCQKKVNKQHRRTKSSVSMQLRQKYVCRGWGESNSVDKNLALLEDSSPFHSNNIWLLRAALNSILGGPKPLFSKDICTREDPTTDTYAYTYLNMLKWNDLFMNNKMKNQKLVLSSEWHQSNGKTEELEADWVAASHTSVIPAVRKLKQEGDDLWVSLGYIRICFRKNKRTSILLPYFYSVLKKQKPTWEWNPNCSCLRRKKTVGANQIGWNVGVKRIFNKLVKHSNGSMLI